MILESFFCYTNILRQAFQATCKKRGTENLIEEGPAILEDIRDDVQLQMFWEAYQRKYIYASDMSFYDIIKSVDLLRSKI